MAVVWELRQRPGPQCPEPGVRLSSGDPPVSAEVSEQKAADTRVQARRRLGVT